MRMSVYRDNGAYVLRPQFNGDEIAYLRGHFGESDRERLAFTGSLTKGLWLWLQNDSGYRLRPTVNGKGKRQEGWTESRIPCIQIDGPTQTIVTRDVTVEHRFWKSNVPAIFIPPQFPFSGDDNATEPFNPLMAKDPLHWQPPSGKDDKIKIVPPDSAPRPQPAAVEAAAEDVTVARQVEPQGPGSTTAATAEQEGSRVSPPEPPSPPTEKVTVTDGYGDYEIEQPCIPARTASSPVPPNPEYHRPLKATPIKDRKELKEALELVNAYMDGCGDDIVLKIVGNRVKASLLVVQEIDL